MKNTRALAVALFRLDNAEVLIPHLERELPIFWEFIPLVLRKERYAVEVRPCEKSDIMEIDNYYELAQLDETYR